MLYAGFPISQQRFGFFGHLTLLFPLTKRTVSLLRAIWSLLGEQQLETSCHSQTCAERLVCPHHSSLWAQLLGEASSLLGKSNPVGM